MEGVGEELGEGGRKGRGRGGKLSHQSKSTKICPATVGVKGLRFTPRKSLNRELIMFPALSSLQPSRSP